MPQHTAPVSVNAIGVPIVGEAYETSKLGAVVSDPVPDVPDELVERARRGEEAALRGLAELVHPSIERWALIHMGDPDEADDLTQDVLMIMLRRLDSFAGRSRFTTWLYAITRNAALDRLRSDHRRGEASSDPRALLALVPVDADDPAQEAERARLRTLLGVLFGELPWRQREIFDLVELQGKSAIHAAELLGIEPVSVRAHLFKARRRLRKTILDRWPELVEDHL